MPADCGPDTDVWVRTVVGWHVAFWVMLGIAAASAVAAPDSTPRTWAVLALLATLGLAYAALGGPAARSRDGRRATAYVGMLIVVVATVVWLRPSVSFLLCIAYPQVWFLLDRLRDAVLATLALTVAVAVAILVALDGSGASVRGVGVSMGVSLLFSLALGLWISRVIDQSRERAVLIEALRVARSELLDAHHAQGVMAERERMAREIHDTLAQGFTSVVMLAQAAQAELAASPAAATARLQFIEHTARENLAEARALVGAYSPVALSGGGLGDALGRLAERFGRETGTAVTVHLEPGLGPLAADQQVVLLRAAQEALANVRKHAGAHTVEIRLSRDEAGTRIDVVDDGAGFDQSAAGGLGLAGLHQRVAAVGGELDVRTAPGAGTRIRVRVPPMPAEVGGAA